MLYSLAILDVNLDRNMKRMFRAMVKKAFPDCSTAEKHQLFLANQHFSPDWRILTHNEKAAVLTAARKDEIKQSKMEVKFSRRLLSLDPHFESSVFIEEVASFVDLFSSEQKRVIQFDGPSHFLSNGMYDGSSQFQSRLLRKFGYNVDRVPYKNSQLFIGNYRKSSFKSKMDQKMKTLVT